MSHKFAGRPSSAQSRLSFSGRVPFVAQRVSERVNPVSNTGGYFYNSNRFDRRLSLTSSSSGVAACLGHPDHFSSKINEHANKNTYQNGNDAHAYVRPTHSRGRTSSSVVVHRPLSTSLDSKPFTREEMKQDIREVSANVIHTFDPVRRTIAYPSVRQTPTFSSSVFAHLPQFNELRNPPRNTQLGQGFVKRRAAAPIEHPVSNGNGQIVVYDSNVNELPPAGSVNSATPSVQIAHAVQPYVETRQETAQTIAQMKSGNYVDNTSNKIYGVTHISPTKRRYVEPKNLPSLTDADQRKLMYDTYKQDLINEIEMKERQAQELKMQNRMISQKPRSAFEFECYEREKNRLREIADVSAQQRQQMAMVKQRNAIEKVSSNISPSLNHNSQKLDIEQGVKSIEHERGMLMDDVDRLQRLIEQKRGKLKKFYESSINARENQKVKKIEEAQNEKKMIKAAIEHQQELEKRRFEEQKMEKCELANYQIQQMNTKHQNQL